VTGLGAANVGEFSTTQHAGNGDFGDIAISPTGAVMIAYQRPHGSTAPSTLYVALDPDGLGSGIDAWAALSSGRVLPISVRQSVPPTIVGAGLHESAAEVHACG
jgi:hypothetical protein